MLLASARWQITVCDPIWYAGSRSSVVNLAQTAILLYIHLYKELLARV